MKHHPSEWFHNQLKHWALDLIHASKVLQYGHANWVLFYVFVRICFFVHAYEYLCTRTLICSIHLNVKPFTDFNISQERVTWFWTILRKRYYQLTSNKFTKLPKSGMNMCTYCRGLTSEIRIMNCAYKIFN